MTRAYAHVSVLAGLLLLTGGAWAQSAASGEPDINLHLMHEETEAGSVVDHTVDVPVLTTSDFVSVQVHQRPDAPNPDIGFGLLFRLTPDGARRLAEVVRRSQGRSLVLRSHGRSFNALRIKGEFQEEWLLWTAPLHKAVAKRWLRHITGEELLPDPFEDDA